MEILMGWLTPVRAIFIWIDCIAFSLLDNVYDLFQVFSEQKVIGDQAVKTLMNNIYILVGLIAFFKLAFLLVNSVINPEKMNASGKGLGSIGARVAIMLGLLITSPLIFDEMMTLQSYVVENNIIPKTIIASTGGTDIKNRNYISDAGKTMQKIVITTLIKPDERYFINGEDGVTEYLNDATLADDSKNGPAALDPYVIADCNKTCKKAMAQYHQMIMQDSKGGFKLRRLAGYIGGSRELPDDSGDLQDVYYYEYISVVTTITAIFITYVLLSFSIDIAVRSVELAVLRVLSPLFIATIVDPKSTSSGGYFNNYIKRVGKTYGDLFLKLAIISFMVLGVSLIQDADILGNIGR